MQSLNDRNNVLGEVLADELKLIREYVEDVPDIKRSVHKMSTTVEEINDRLIVIENVVQAQETDIRTFKSKVA